MSRNQRLMMKNEHRQDYEVGTLTRKLLDYIRGTRKEVDFILQIAVEFKRLSKKDAEKSESLDVSYDRWVRVSRQSLVVHVYSQTSTSY